MQIRKLLVFVTLAGLGAAAATATWRHVGDGDGRAAPASLDSALAGIDRLASGFPAPGNATLEFPADHASKPGQFAESWLFAGLLRDEAGAAWGFQLAFQRVALQAQPVRRDSAWAARSVWRARLIIEPADAPAVAAERVSRAALGLAGASDSPAGAWVEGWRFEVDESGSVFHLQGTAGGSGLDLRLHRPERAPVAIGREPYRGYWWPGLAASGTLMLAGREFAVSGPAMLDHVWGRGLPTGRGQLALASLWLELADGSAYRCEQLRRRAGGGTPLTECVTDRAGPGKAVELAPHDDGWRVLDDIRYPLHWVLRPGAGSESWRLAPLSTAGAISLEGAWSGVVAPAGNATGWGLLQLSNFAAP